jgi:hypothetical protein
VKIQNGSLSTDSLGRSVLKRKRSTLNFVAMDAAGAIALSALLVAACSSARLIAQAPDTAAITEPSNTPPVPHLIKYTGILTDGRGYPITVPIDATFSLYEQAAAVPGEQRPALWQETQHLTPNDKGVYTVYLGSETPLGLPAGVFTSVTAQYLGVKMEGDAELPRTLLVSVPYALKAGDAQTLGGLPASAYALARSQTSAAEAAPAALAPDSASTVTTTGGASGYLSEFSGSTTIVDSPIFVNGSNVGINTKSPSANFQVNGTSALGVTTVAGTLKLNATGAATKTSGDPSQQQQFQTSAYNSSVSEAIPQTFAWQALPVNNNTTSASGALGLLFGSGTAAPAATGLAIARNGVIFFAPGQSFPGTGKGTITGITAGTDLVGGGTSGNVTLALNTSKLITGITAGSGLTGGGTTGAVTLALDTTKVPTLTDNPTFTGTITANSKTSGKPAVAANGTNGGYGISANSDTAYAGKFINNSGNFPSVYSSTNASQGGIALYGSSPGADGIGLYTNAFGAGGFGVYSIASGGADSSGIEPTGVFGEVYSTGVGVEGVSTSNGTGVEGQTQSGAGLLGMSTTGEAVYGIAGTGIAGYFISVAPENETLFAYNGANADSTSTLPIASMGEALGTNAIGVEGFSGAGIGVKGIAGALSNLGARFQNDGYLAGVWGDTAEDGSYPFLAGVVGSADDNSAGYFQNDSDTFATLGAYNAGSAGQGLFKTFQASTPTGTCGFGSGDLTCTGQVKTLASTSNGAKKVETYGMQSPENWMEDFGSGTIKNGVAVVTIDSAFAETANTGTDYHVFLTPNGDSKGLYVVARTATSFEVRESGGGISSVSFDYRIVAKRRGYEAQRLVDVTERFEAETTAAAKRMIAIQSTRVPTIKPPTAPIPRAVRTPRAIAAPQVQDARPAVASPPTTHHS